VKIRVFLADDHAVLRDSLRMLLEAAPDVTVVGAASNGIETVREVQRLRPDVVVMDIGMPELNGIDATRQIRERCPGTHVVILSVFETSQHIFDALKAGAEGYLLKESAGDQVLKAIEAVCRGQVYFCPKIAKTVVQDYVKRGGEVPRKSPLESLSMRERQILQLVAEGKSSSEVADIVHLSSKTVETYRSRLMRKLGTNNITDLVKFAILHGLIPLE